MALSKYIKAPTTPNLSLYTDSEFRKLENVLGNFLADFQELQDMSLIESGTFTPRIDGGTSAGAGTYTTRVGDYYKIGRFIIIRFRVTTTAHTGTGNILITDLPHPIRSGNSELYFSNRVYAGALTAEFLLGRAGESNLTAWSGAVPPIQQNITAAMDFAGSFSYFTD